MNSQEAPVGPLFMAWMFMAWIVLSPAPHDINNEGDDDNQEQEIEGESDIEDQETDEEEPTDDESTDEDEGIGNEIQDLRREVQELRQTLADRKRELAAASAEKTQKILPLWYQGMQQPIALPVAAGGGGGGAMEQVGGEAGGNQMPVGNQQIVKRASRQAALLAWARARPEWQPEHDRLTVRYDGFASAQEIEIFTFIHVLEILGLAPPGLEPRRPGNQGKGGFH